MPISPEVARVLALVMDGDRDGHIALSHRGTRWGQHGLAQAFERVLKQSGLQGWSVYCLRHYAITSWLRAGIPVHVVQRMAGHVHLSTTQRYVHFLKATSRKLLDASPRVYVVVVRMEATKADRRSPGSGLIFGRLRRGPAV